MPINSYYPITGIFKKDRFPFYRQLDAKDCGPSCLRMIARYYGKSYSLQFLREITFIGREGVSFHSISSASESIGLRSLAVQIHPDKLQEMPVPCIAHWRHNHFIVVYRVKKNKVYVADPAHGLMTYSQDEFFKGWINHEHKEGFLLLLEVAPDFYQKTVMDKKDKTSFNFLLLYLKVHKWALGRIALLMLLGSLVQMAFPFLTQALVDKGIGNKNVNFLVVVLMAQLVLYISQTIFSFIRSRILLFVGTRINISIISDFLAKLMRLPLSFFDSKMIGDILQRINDHHRIEAFLTSTILGSIFSMINLVTFSIVLCIYNYQIFLIFFLGSIIYILWVLFFLKRRRELDYKRFSELSTNQSNLIQIIRGMPEIKLNTSEKRKRWEWRQVQEKLFSINLSSLKLSQYQQGGANLISQLTNTIIIFIVAWAVIQNKMTLGMMMAVQYIIGQLIGPIEQILSFIRATQDAKISLERLGEIHNQENEEELDENKRMTFPSDKSIHIDGLKFQYEGPHSPFVLNNVTLTIPENKVTAIVGESGSGKTTLLKLLLKFYRPTNGRIKLGNTDLEALDNKRWRQKCGAVMQEGFIFSDTIARNIAIADEKVNQDKVRVAAEMANIQEFIESLPLGYDTKIGIDGHDLSRGQKQRILIARSVYKNPEYLLFDEATNALDSSNEREIMEKLDRFFNGKTVVIIAHRLSTVQNADQIVVLDNGSIVEQGSHQELTKLRGSYYQLVKNQLDLG